MALKGKQAIHISPRGTVFSSDPPFSTADEPLRLSLSYFPTIYSLTIKGW